MCNMCVMYISSYALEYIHTCTHSTGWNSFPQLQGQTSKEYILILAATTPPHHHPHLSPSPSPSPITLTHHLTITLTPSPSSITLTHHSHLSSSPITSPITLTHHPHLSSSPIILTYHPHSLRHLPTTLIYSPGTVSLITLVPALTTHCVSSLPWSLLSPLTVSHHYPGPCSHHSLCLIITLVLALTRLS